MPAEGVLFYSLGVKCAVRLAVAMRSLRKHYAGPATLVHTGFDSMESAAQLAATCGVDFKPVTFRTSPGHNVALLNKTLLQEVTPYDVSAFLDADTLTVRPFPELFDAAREHEYAIAAFSDWKTWGTIRKRIKQWRGIVPDAWLEAALKFGPAINTGVFAFRRDSHLQAALYDYAVRARDFFIPDEIGVQVLLPQYPHKMLGNGFNCSCKYDDPRGADVRVIHFHGGKHARIQGGKFLNNSDLWLRAFEEVREWPAVQRHIQDDRQLRNNLKAWDKVKGAVL